MMTNINVLTLKDVAILTSKKAFVYHVELMERFTDAELNLDQTWRMVDKLLEGHSSCLSELR